MNKIKQLCQKSMSTLLALILAIGVCVPAVSIGSAVSAPEQALGATTYKCIDYYTDYGDSWSYDKKNMIVSITRSNSTEENAFFDGYLYKYTGDKDKYDVYTDAGNELWTNNFNYENGSGNWQAVNFTPEKTINDDGTFTLKYDLSDLDNAYYLAVLKPNADDYAWGSIGCVDQQPYSVIELTNLTGAQLNLKKIVINGLPGVEDGTTVYEDAYASNPNENDFDLSRFGITVPNDYYLVKSLSINIDEDEALYGSALYYAPKPADWTGEYASVRVDYQDIGTHQYMNNCGGIYYVSTDEFLAHWTETVDEYGYTIYKPIDVLPEYINDIPGYSYAGIDNTSYGYANKGNNGFSDDNHKYWAGYVLNYVNENAPSLALSSPDGILKNVEYRAYKLFDADVRDDGMASNLVVSDALIGTDLKAIAGQSSNRPMHLTPARLAAIDRAFGELGKPYQWGAAGPHAYDCSGLVYYVLTGNMGSHPWTTGTIQGWERTAEPQPGDICINSHHCGIYVGGGQMIHAPQTGDVVKVSGVHAGMWYVKYEAKPYDTETYNNIPENYPVDLTQKVYLDGDLNTAQGMAEFIASNIKDGDELYKDSFGMRLAKDIAVKDVPYTTLTADSPASQLPSEGYYLIVRTDTLTGETSVASSPLFAPIHNGMNTIELKAGIPAVDKLVMEDEGDDNWTKIADHSVNQTVPYKITGSVAENVDNYSTYSYIVHDEFDSAHMNIDMSSIKVMVGDTDITDAANINVRDINIDNFSWSGQFVQGEWLGMEFIQTDDEGNGYYNHIYADVPEDKQYPGFPNPVLICSPDVYEVLSTIDVNNLYVSCGDEPERVIGLLYGDTPEILLAPDDGTSGKIQFYTNKNADWIMINPQHMSLYNGNEQIVIPTTKKELTISFDDLYAAYPDLNKTDKITITYDGKQIAESPRGTQNDAYIEYSNNPTNALSLGSTPKTSTRDYSYMIRLVKTDNATGERLPGANFTITNEDGTYIGIDENGLVKEYLAADYEAEDFDKTLCTWTSDKDGIISIKGVDADKYAITEISAPQYYDVLADPFMITIEGDRDENSLDGEGWQMTETAELITDTDLVNEIYSSSNPLIDLTDEWCMQVNVKNIKQIGLPSTGALGLGLLLAIAAALAIRASIKRKKEEQTSVMYLD